MTQPTSHATPDTDPNVTRDRAGATSENGNPNENLAPAEHALRDGPAPLGSEGGAPDAASTSDRRSD